MLPYEWTYQNTIILAVPDNEVIAGTQEPKGQDFGSHTVIDITKEIFFGYNVFIMYKYNGMNM